MALLDSLIEHAGIPIFTTDLAGVITHFNPAAEQLYGRAAEEVIDRHVTLLMPGHVHSEHERAMWSAGREGRPWDSTTEHVRSDGQVLPVRLMISPVKDADGAVVGLGWFCVDIGERMAFQGTLQQERDLLEAILETTNDAIVMFDTDGRLVTANLQFETFFRLQRHLIVGHPIERLVDLIRERPDLPTDLMNLLVTFGTDRYQSAGGDFEIATPERRVLVWYSAPVHAHDGAIMGRLFVFRDATHEREVDRMKTEFVSLVSHELRTPLTSIKGFAEFILDGDAGPVTDEIRSYVEVIRVNTERLTALISDILDLTRIEARRIELHPGSYRLEAIVDSVLVSMRPLIEGRRQRITTRIAPDLPPIWADRDRLAQIITNLLSNASKYTAEQGDLRIIAEVVHSQSALPPSAPKALELPAFVISVHDNGMGIGAEEHQAVFARFYRTDQAASQQIQGSGLGLTIVKSFVELHGGNIWLESTPGQGTSVYFTIPLIEGV